MKTKRILAILLMGSIVFLSSTGVFGADDDDTGPVRSIGYIDSVETTTQQ